MSRKSKTSSPALPSVLRERIRPLAASAQGKVTQQLERLHELASMRRSLLRGGKTKSLGYLGLMGIGAQEGLEGPLDGLRKLGVKNAVYCDMGYGWNYSWFRKADGSVKEIFTSPGQYTTNWVVFYRE